MELAARLLADLEQRFWARVVKTETCWFWTGAGSRYGHLRVAGCDVGAHVLAWELAYGAVPVGLQVCHTCDTPKCVRGDHLFLGTQGDNLRDMWAKGRNGSGSVSAEKRVRGETHGAARLTERQVIEMRAAYAAGGVRLVDLAEQFNVGVSTVHDAVNGKKWKHLPLAGEPPHGRVQT